MIRAVLMVSLFAPALVSQIVGVISQFPPQLKQYMELTDAQISSIVQINTSFQTFQLEKSRRIGQVQIELFQETAKPVIDAMALGVRHLELESIRRELQAEQSKVATQIQNVLTAAQKTKLQALEQAMQLQSVICEAQAMNLLGQRQFGAAPIAVNPFYSIPVNRWFDTSAFLLPTAACGTGIRSGSFNFVTGPAPPQP
jgi:Spy/CpxP family protein refolding chaperone